MTEKRYTIFKTIRIIVSILVFSAIFLVKFNILYPRNRVVYPAYKSVRESTLMFLYRNIEFPEQLRSGHVWQPISGQDSYIYSAFLDRKNPHRQIIRAFIIVASSRKQSTRYCCYLWYRNSQNATEVEGTLGLIRHHVLNNFAFQELQCEVGRRNDTVYAVSVTEGQCTYPTNFIQVPDNKETEHNQWEFTVCISPIHGKFNNVNRLVEFIEIHKIFGAQKFVIYDFDTGKSVLKYLEYYKDKGLVDVYPYVIPSHVDVHYYGQFGALNDCLYRYMDRSKYIAFVDLDEVIVPEENYTWRQMMKNLEKEQHEFQPKCAFVFRSSFFPLRERNDNETSMNRLVVNNNIVSLLKTMRESKVFKHPIRSKLIVNPKKIRIMDVHVIDETFDNCSSFYVSENLAFLHHYRNNDESVDPIKFINRTMLKYTDELVQNIISVKKEFNQTYNSS